jgi:hypothetical protein
VWGSEELMFDINLLSDQGIQPTEISNCSISFIKHKAINSPKPSNDVNSKKVINKKPRRLPSVSLYAIIFFAIAGVIFYPMLSKLNFNIPIQSEKISQEVVIDRVLKVILQSKNDYSIESLQFSDGNILIRLSSFDMKLMKFFKEEIDIFNSGAIRFFGESDNYSMIAKFPWEIIKNYNSISSPESFFEFVKTGKNVQTVISEHEIAMRGSTSDIISIFLQLANAERLQTNEMVIHSIDSDSLIFAVKFSN